MNHKWICAYRLSKEFEDGVVEFIRVVVSYAEKTWSIKIYVLV